VRARGWLAAAGVGLCCAAGTASASSPVRVLVAGQPLPGSAPLLVGGVTYVPLRAVAEALGAAVAWDPSSQTASVTPGPGIDAGLPALVTAVEPSIVGVVAVQFASTGQPSAVSSGSGVVIGPDGLVVTNDHVVVGGQVYWIVTSSRQALQVPASAIWADPDSDLAFLRTGDAALPPAPLGSSAAVQVGESVFTIGNPLGEELADTVTRGVISGVGRTVGADAANPSGELYPVLQTDAAINPGNSGGALVDMQGRVIGITSEKLSGTDLQGLGFAKPSALVEQMLASFQKYGYVARPWLGATLSDPWQVAYGLPTTAGPTVTGTVPGGPADRAGILPGDQIVTAGGQAVHSEADLEAVISAAAVGAALPVTVQRLGRTHKLTVTLTQRQG